MHPSGLDVTLHADPRATIGALLHLTGTPPTVDDLRSHVAERLPAIPAWSTTITRRGVRAHWTRLDADLRRQVRGHLLPEGQHPRDAVRHLQHTSFAPGSPRWDLTLLHGYAPDRYAILYRVNHGLQDGGGLVRTAEALFSQTPIEPKRSAATARVLAFTPKPLPHRLAAIIGREVRASASPGPWARYGCPHSSERNSNWCVVPAGLLSGIARPYAGTPHDAHLAALAITTSGWLTRHVPDYAASAGLRIQTAVNVRHPRDIDQPGNHIGAASIFLPSPTAANSEFLRATVEATRFLKSPVHRAATHHFTRRIPSPAQRAAFRWVNNPKRTTALTSCLTIRHPLHFRDDPVTAIDPIGAPPAAPLLVVLAFYQGSASVQFITDAGLPEMDQLHVQWHKVVHQLAAGL
ncbi:wax ester/triacylglycerol synthase domain-containing protein [Streptomyces subrutilus]|uniref:wax ester/triacylglycerol synthase domain-containing protein n=1 Tax=Streptomyces subrutilus TaxID=36818 RepID=UPI00340BFC5D